jgi:hypothetical protein
MQSLNRERTSLTQSQQSQRSFLVPLSSAPRYCTDSRPLTAWRAGRRGKSRRGVSRTGEGGKCGRAPSGIRGLRRFPCRGRQILCRSGSAPDPSLRHGARCRRSGGSAEGWGVAGGHPRFSRETPMPPERPGSQPSPIPAARFRELPDRTRGGGNVPARRTHRCSPPGSTARQAPGKDARQVEASAGCGAYTAGKVSAEDSAILTVAGACDGTTAGFAAQRTAAWPTTRSAMTEIGGRSMRFARIISGAHWNRRPGPPDARSGEPSPTPPVEVTSANRPRHLERQRGRSSIIHRKRYAASARSLSTVTSFSATCRKPPAT